MELSTSRITESDYVVLISHCGKRLPFQSEHSEMQCQFIAPGRWPSSLMRRNKPVGMGTGTAKKLVLRSGS